MSECKGAQEANVKKAIRTMGSIKETAGVVEAGIGGYSRGVCVCGEGGRK